MKELSIEQVELVSGGCSFTDMMFYAGMFLGYLSKRDWFLAGAYSAKLVGCM